MKKRSDLDVQMRGGLELGFDYNQPEDKIRQTLQEHRSMISSSCQLFLTKRRSFSYSPATLTTNLVPLIPIEADGVSNRADSGASFEMSPER